MDSRAEQNVITPRHRRRLAFVRSQPRLKAEDDPQFSVMIAAAGEMFGPGLANRRGVEIAFATQAIFREQAVGRLEVDGRPSQTVDGT